MEQSLHDDICEDRDFISFSVTPWLLYLKTSISKARSFLFYRRFLSYMRMFISLAKTEISHPAFPDSRNRFSSFHENTHPPRARHQHISRFSLADLPQKVMKTQNNLCATRKHLSCCCFVCARVFIFTRPREYAALLCARENV